MKWIFWLFNVFLIIIFLMMHIIIRKIWDIVIKFSYFVTKYHNIELFNAFLLCPISNIMILSKFLGPIHFPQKIVGKLHCVSYGLIIWSCLNVYVRQLFSVCALSCHLQIIEGLYVGNLWWEKHLEISTFFFKNLDFFFESNLWPTPMSHHCFMKTWSCIWISTPS